MSRQRTIYISADEHVSFSISFSELSHFIKEALGEHFIQSENESLTTNETVFLSKENTVIRVKEDCRRFKVMIESDTAQVVNGLINYLDEVFEYTIFELMEHH